MSKNSKRQYRYTQNRELSWLRFNRRVLEEAADSSVPPLERFKFISIFSSNLDEFFMVRVGSLFDISCATPDDTDNKTGWSADEQLRRIYHTVPDLLELKKRLYTVIMQELARNGIEDVPPGKAEGADLKQINRFFKAEMLPILSPILIGPNHPVPHLVNKNLYAAALLEDKKGHRAIGIVPLPESLPPFLMLSDGKRYVRCENILLRALPSLFGAYAVKESCVICVTRNADINFDDEKFDDNDEDLRVHMKKMLKKRDHLGIVRLELSVDISEDFLSELTSVVRVRTHRIFTDPCPLNMGYVFALIGALPKNVAAKLLYKPYREARRGDFCRDLSVFSQVWQADRLLFYPYDSTEPFLRLLNEAADDPKVLSVKITIYRLASTSKVAQALCRAAENGKEVLVIMELRARFDESNNLAWSKMLKSAGCQVIYGAEGFKCHSKICLITYRSHNRTSYITQIGTGNYNEKTNTMYTDLSLMTADPAIGEDAAEFFRNMPVNNLDGKYGELCVSPFGIKSMFIENADRQIALGKDGYICIKANSVTEREVIDKIAEASQAGVKVDMIIRGICCILPKIPGYTDNVSMTSIVGRYLEHARIYQFGRGDNAKMYISSADLMTRNLNRRVEIACPVKDRRLREQLQWILSAQLHDTAKASEMMSDGTYSRLHSPAPFDSQEYFMQNSPHIPPERKKGLGLLRSRLKRLREIWRK